MKVLLKAILISTALVISLPQLSKAQISNPKAELTKLDSDKIWPQTLEGSHFNEFWNYHFYFDNGIVMHIIFNAANFGRLKSPVTGLRVSVYNLDDQVHQLQREYSLEHLILDKENQRFQNRAEREIYFEGLPPDSHRIRIYTTKDGVTYDIDLKFDDIQPGFKMGDGKYGIGNETIGIVTHIPYATVTGTVAVNNSRADVKGTGYMDHTYQDQTTTTLIDKGFRFTNHSDPDNWDILYFMLPNNTERGRTIGHRVTKKDGEITIQQARRVDEIVESRTFDKQVARSLKLHTGSNRSLQLVRSADHEKFAILGELGRIARRAARTFLGGEVIDFRGEATLIESGHRPITGHYNYFIVD